ncbi:RNA-binding protein 25-like [Macrobrachium nipponense]|uniref:RNA-binding protein 25-like n=1 Tax=Macrobrachium nipponense TaxID=159736 RepID=UPI0030C84EF9
MSSIAELTALGKELGYEGEDLRRFVSDEQSALRDIRNKERELEREKLEAAREERERERQEKEKEREYDREKSERDRAHEIRLYDMQESLQKQEIEKLKLQKEIKDSPVNTEGSDTEGNQVRVKVKGPSIPDFDENKDDIDAYLRRFEVLASAAKWPKGDWAIILSSHLKGAALEVYVRLSPEDALDYNKVSESLMKRFDCTEEGFRVKFRSVKPQKNELVEQFVSRLRYLLKRWI